MIRRLPYWKPPYRKLSPVPSGAFCFLMCLRGYSDSLAGVITSHSCGVAAWIHCGGGRDHGNSHFSNRLNLDAAPVWADTSRPGLCQRGMTMYRLADVDFSNRLGVVVSELAPEQMDRQDQTLGAKPKATRSDPATASSADRDLEMAVFGAA